jgi:heme exporter protein C
MKLSGILLPWVSVLCVGLLGVGTYGALFVAPADYQQGEAARIMYVHVPAAWMSLATFVFMAVASALALIFRHPLSDLCANGIRA